MLCVLASPPRSPVAYQFPHVVCGSNIIANVPSRWTPERVARQVLHGSGCCSVLPGREIACRMFSVTGTGRQCQLIRKPENGLASLSAYSSKPNECHLRSASTETTGVRYKANSILPRRKRFKRPEFAQTHTHTHTHTP